MPKVTFIEHDGTPHTVEIASGQSLMRAAVHNDVPGVAAECGGACACATCQVFVDDAWKDKIPSPAAMEQSMLDDEEDDRRLSCQITVTDALDGLVVRLPEKQGY